MIDFPHLKTPRLEIRLADSQDVPGLLAYFRENEARFAPTHPVRDAEFYSREYWLRQIDTAETELKEEISARLVLFDAEFPTKVVGTVNLSGIARGVFHAAYLGYDLAAAYEGRGIMTEALGAVIDYAFTVRNLHRLMANYQPFNVRSAAVLHRLGFVIEGAAKDYLFLNGAWRDHVLTSLTNERWKNCAR